MEARKNLSIQSLNRHSPTLYKLEHAQGDDELEGDDWIPLNIEFTVSLDLLPNLCLREACLISTFMVRPHVNAFK